jgi:chromosome segregation ATPase
MERYRLLTERVGKLSRLNADLEARLRSAEQSLRTAEDQLRVSETSEKSPKVDISELLETRNKLRSLEQQLLLSQREFSSQIEKSAKINEELRGKLAQTEERLYRAERTVQDTKREFDGRIAQLTKLNDGLETRLRVYRKRWEKIIRTGEALNKARSDLMTLIENRDDESATPEDPIKKRTPRK